MQPLLCSHLQLAEGRHSDNPTTIPITANFWSDNPGISGRFPSESVVGFFRNHWSVINVNYSSRLATTIFPGGLSPCVRGVRL